VTVAEVDRIDIIATRPGSSEVRLIIADHLDWGDVHAHCLQLQAKFNAYLAFVESGQMAQRPDVAAIAVPEISIEVVGIYEPPPAGREFLARSAEFLAGVGVRFRFDLEAAT
jgi:uncharacterized protein DUF6572